MADSKYNFGINKNPVSMLDVNGPIGLKSPTTQSSAAYTVAESDFSIIANSTQTLTLTLPAASICTGRLYMLKTIAAQAVVSASSNVVPLAGGAAGVSILSSTAGKWAKLQSDGTNWIVMAGA